MLKFQAVLTKKELKEAAVIEQRRRNEADRKHRIFDARNRIFGVDCEGIQQQIAEKTKQRQEELERERKFVEQQKRQTETIELKEVELQNGRRRIVTELNEFREFYQKPKQSREFDIHNPNGLRCDNAARIGDDDPRMTISGGQIFLGEDLEAKKRKKAQNEQQKSWLLQQMEERRRIQESEKEIERKHCQSILEYDQRAADLDNAHRLRQKKIHANTFEYNLSLAAEQAAERQKQKCEEQNDNLAEVYNHLTSDILSENPDVANSALGPHRKIASQYKGMQEEEIEEVRMVQQRQKSDLERQKTDAKIEQQKWDSLSQQQARKVLLKERELGRQMKNLTLNLLEDNAHLADEQKQQAQYKDRVLYTNQPTSEYFAQFNTVTR